MEIFDFIKKAPTAFHAAAEMKNILLSAGAKELKENEPWEIEKGTMYFVIRNDSALIAFLVPAGAKGFRVFAAHGDSPTFKIKENPEINVENRYVKLNTERYGGMIMSSWLDRPLSVAGRLLVRGDEGVETRLVNIDRDLLLIPNLCIHMNRKVNDGYTFNPQKDMLPLFGDNASAGKFMERVAEAAGVNKEDILGHDLYLYNRTEPVLFGDEEEFMASPRLDDVECALAGLMGFLAGKKEAFIPLFVMYDNEEVGSGTRQGAASTFLKDTVEGISEALSDTPAVLRQRISESFMLSADNGHALHPNFPEMTDPTNRPVLNGGILLKYSANQRYTTDGKAAAMLKLLSEEADVPYQIFFNRSDMLGGSTLGNISTAQIPFMTADIGLTELAMHSSYETAGVKDYEYMKKLAETLFS